MKLTEKVVRGSRYLYFQDFVKTTRGPKTISTYIGRADMNPQELNDAKGVAFFRHVANLDKVKNIVESGYSFEFTIPLIANAIIDIKTAYGWVRPLVRPEEWEKVERLFYHKYVYGTTAIEGVMLTEQETAKVLETELTPQNKPVLDVYAVNNYKHLKLFLKGYRGPINEKVIKQIHDILMYGMRNERGEPVARGVYREMPVIIQGLGYRPPPAEQVPQQMRYLVAEYEAKSREGIHQVELASIFHQKFEEIHPFQDGNGRVGREILNIMLERAGFPPIYVTPESRSDYIGALEKGNSGDFLPLIQFVTNRMGATINFIYSKTGVYEIISAKKVRELSKNDELYNAVISTLQESREGDDLP